MSSLLKRLSNISERFLFMSDINDTQLDHSGHILHFAKIHFGNIHFANIHIANIHIDQTRGVAGSAQGPN